jgi:probable HAF family extracellular repeat protein
MFHQRLRLLAFSTLTAATALTGVAFALPAHAAATPQYTLKIIGGQGTQVFGINKNGAIFGTADESGAVTQEGFLLQAGSTTMQFLGAPGDQANANSLVSPGGINAAADVVGFTESDKTGTITAAEWPDSSTPTNLGSLAGVQNLVTAPEATAINDNGLITGFGSDGHGEAGFTIQGSTVTRLPALPNGGVDVIPVAVSNSGLVVGKADNSTTGTQAAEWSNGAITALGGLPGSTDSQATAVNASGEAVGTSVDPADSDGHAVLYANGTVTDLHAPGTGDPESDAEANAINDSGVIVGQGGNGDAFVYSNGQATDLNTLIAAGSGFTLNVATGINDNGVIVGTASLAAHPNETFGFELTPNA